MVTAGLLPSGVLLGFPSGPKSGFFGFLNNLPKVCFQANLAIRFAVLVRSFHATRIPALIPPITNPIVPRVLITLSLILPNSSILP